MFKRTCGESIYPVLARVELLLEKRDYERQLVDNLY